MPKKKSRPPIGKLTKRRIVAAIKHDIRRVIIKDLRLPK